MAVSNQIFFLRSYTRMRKRLFAHYLLGVTLYFYPISTLYSKR